MDKKDHEWRVHVRLPEHLKQQYAAACEAMGRKMSEDIRAHIEGIVAERKRAIHQRQVWGPDA